MASDLEAARLLTTTLRRGRAGERTGGKRPIADIAATDDLRQRIAMSDDKKALLRALALMCDQYIGEGDWIDHQCMAAGEEAVELLVTHGMIEPSGRGGRWTEAGKALLR